MAVRLLRTETVEAAGNGLGISLMRGLLVHVQRRAAGGELFFLSVGVAVPARHWLQCRGGVARVCEHVSVCTECALKFSVDA